jgi:hypothetical protein
VKRAIARAVFVGSAIVVIALVTSVTTRPPIEGQVLHVPNAGAAMRVDGEVDEVAWQHAARTGAFRCEGVAVCPFSEARFLWSGEQLYVHLYAADSDIRSAAVGREGAVWLGDHFRLTFTGPGEQRVLDVSPRGTVTDARRRAEGTFDYAWDAGAQVGTDVDGTIDVPGDEDEEWALELAIPLSSLGLRPAAGERIGISVRRCDVPLAGPKQCSSDGPHPLILD